MRIFRKETTVSTNLDAREGVPGDVFVAEHQSAGRGRLDHTWLSAKGENLTFSVVLAGADRSLAEIATLPLVVGLAVIKALGRFAPLALKWPNDVLSDGRKLAGILCERDGDNVIAGIGINVNQTSFPPEIAARATSLAAICGRRFNREKVLSDVLESLDRWHGKWLAEGFASLHGDLAAVDCLRGRTVCVRQVDDDTAPVSGFCGGIAEDGSLIVGGRPVYAGEAHIGGL